MVEVRCIDPGCETVEERLAAIRDLGLMHEAALMEIDALDRGAIPATGDERADWQCEAWDRCDAAAAALSAEIYEARGMFGGLVLWWEWES